jgi:RHS repeat-associated protein
VSATGPSGASSFTFNDDNQQSSATTAAGTATYTYDPAGRLATAVDPLSGVTAGYGYDDANRLTGISYGTGNATRSYGYDALGRQTSDTINNPAGTATASTTYGYDTADRLVSKTTTGVAGAAANTYTYDQAGQLATWNNGNTTTQYGWDGAGNLTRDGPDTATFNERNQLTTKGATSYTYTPRGTLASRTTSGTTTNIAFNAYDELTTDATTTNTYDGLDRLTTTGTTTLTYTGTGDTVAADGTSTYSYTPSGTPLGVKQGGVASVAVTDLHTDLTALINPATGAVAGSRSYSPFGQPTAAAGTQAALGYQGQYTDPGSGNVNMGSRWYQPTSGGFASRDTAGLDPRDTTNANRYGYAAGDPLTNTDPTGHGVECLVAAGATAETGPGALVVGGGCELGEIAFEWLIGQALRASAQAALDELNRRRAQQNSPSISSSPYYWFATWPSDYDEVHQLRLRALQGHGTPPPPPGIKCGKVCIPRPPRHGSYPPLPGTSAADAAAAAQAAARAAELAHQREIDDRARTPHAEPISIPTISPEIQRQIDAANNATPINLGTLTPEGGYPGDQPYQPQQADTSPGSPGSLPAATGHLADACAAGGTVGADGTRSAQTWACGTAGTDIAVNRKGNSYPQVTDPRTGQPIHYPGDGLPIVPKEDRVQWGGKERAAYIKQWFDRGFAKPVGEWSEYDIHHILPREYGGSNDFANLVPILRDVHKQFTAWWRSY